MDVISATGCAASTLGCIVAFLTDRKQSKSCEVSDFTQWLTQNGLQELHALIDQSQLTTVSVKAHLQSSVSELLSSHETVLEELEGLFLSSENQFRALRKETRQGQLSQFRTAIIAAAHKHERLVDES